MKTIIIITFSTFLSCILPAQLVEQKRFNNIDAECFYVDNLENLYFYNNNSILKTSKQLSKIVTFDNKSFGNISYIDVSDPFRILVFYKDINRLVFLDNYFAELRDPIVLDDLSLYNVDVVCSSSQGGFWVYDSQNSQAVLINKDLVKVQEGTNLYSLVGQSKAKKIKETNNYLFIQFENNQIIVLDKFGNFYKKINIPDIIFFDALNDDIYVVLSTHIDVIKINSEEIIEIKIPDMKVNDFKIGGNYIYILSGKTLIKSKIE
jgi:hypothetical protein